MGVPKGSRWMIKNGDEKLVSPDQVDELLENGWEFGRTKEFCQKTGQSNMGRTAWNKGIPQSKEHRQRNSEGGKGISRGKGVPKSEEHRQKLRKPKSKEGRKNMSIAAIKRIEEKGGGINFNKSSISYLEKFDKKYDIHGLYGKNEFHIPGTRYRVDYFNRKEKLIMEWDEEGHYVNNKLKKKDIQRQKKIQKIFPDFEFRRIREKELVS